MNDAELGGGQEEQGRAHLLRELARQVEGHAAEVGVPQQVVQVVGQHLKHQAQVVPEHEVALQMHWGKGETSIKTRWELGVNYSTA